MKIDRLSHAYHMFIRWVITSQIVNGISVAKACLVARGFENPEVKGRQILQRQIIPSKKWKCRISDVKTAFLKEKQLDRDIYIKPPKEAETTSLWKLNKIVFMG